MTYPVVKDLARDGIPVKLSCRVLGFSRQAYYQWLAEPVSEREWSDAHAANAVLDAHADDPEFGYRFLADELRGRGLAVSDHQVLKACRLVKVRCCHSIRRGSGKRPGPAVHDDLVRREFAPLRSRTSCGSRTSQSIGPGIPSSISARSRTCSRTGSWATRSIGG